MKVKLTKIREIMYTNALFHKILMYCTLLILPPDENDKAWPFLGNVVLGMVLSRLGPF
jgi:hypothetical protein